MSYINVAELETCLLSRSTLSSLIRLLPTAEYDLWVREMTVAGLDFRNIVGLETFNCFKRVCIIERNRNECSWSNPNPKEVQSTTVKKTVRSNYEMQWPEEEDSESEQEITVHAASEQNPKPWNPPAELKFPCPMRGHKQKVSKCMEYFDVSPEDRWKKIEKGRMCLKPKSVCKTRKCNNVSNVPEILKYPICATWAGSKSLAPVSIFFWEKKQQEDSRAVLAELRNELEKYIGTLGTTVMDSKINLLLNFMFKSAKRMKSANCKGPCHDTSILSTAPAFDSKTGAELSNSNLNI